MKILTNSNIIYGEIEKLIENSKEFLFLVSPYIKFEITDHTLYKKFINALGLAIKSDIEVNFISRQPDSSYKGKPKEILKSFIEKGCNLYLVPNLHSKIYCNESKALITSLNMYLHSVINNEEVGVKLSKKHDLKEFEDIIYYIYKLIAKSDKAEEFKKKSQIKNIYLNEKNHNKNYVYILKLENNKWWIGKTKNLSVRIVTHKDGRGSEWTKANRTIDTEKIIEDGDLTTITLNYMKKYGWQNVRGTCFNEGYAMYIPKKIKEYVSKEIGKLNELKDNSNKFLLSNNEDYLVYVLKLENDKWWVGKTTNISKTVKQYKCGKGTPWTTINKVVDVEELREKAQLKEVTLEYMRKYGWENVRGYAWSQWNMKAAPRELRE